MTAVAPDGRSAPDSPKRLPDGWRWVRLGDVCEITMGQSPAGESYNTGSIGVPLLNGPTEFGPLHPIPVQWTTAPTRFAEPGDILFCVRGATTGRMSLADQKYCIGRGLAAIKGKDGRIVTDFLRFLLTIVTDSLLRETAGSTFPNLPGDKLKRFPIGIPSLEKQRRIAAILNEQMAAVERAQAAAEARWEAAKALPAAYLRTIFSSAEAQQWQRKQLKEVCEVVNGFGFPEDLQGRTDLPYPYIKVSDMNADGAEIIVHRAANTVDEGILRAIRAKTYPAGTVIFPKVGGALLTNKKRMLGVEATFDNNVMGLVPIEVESRWLFYWMLTVDLRELANMQALPSIRQSEVASLAIPLPSPAERNHIVAVLDQQMADVQHVGKALEEELTTINALSAALLRRAFSGEI